MTEISQEFIDQMKALRKKNLAELAGDTYNVLLVGTKGIGKTETILKTCRKPAMIHSFDPGGTKVARKEIETGEWGEVFVNKFENDDFRLPTQFKAWEKEFDSMRRNNEFEKFGSYILDSGTSWLQAQYNVIGKTKFANDGVPEIKGWAVLVNTLRDFTRLCTSLPCDFYMTAHVHKFKDDVSGRVLLGLAMPPSLQVTIPLLFDEYYVMTIDPIDEHKRVFYVSTTDRIEAGTRVGKGKFSPIERPDFKYLLQKAGYPYDDKPKILP